MSTGNLPTFEEVINTIKDELDELENLRIKSIKHNEKVRRWLQYAIPGGILLSIILIMIFAGAAVLILLIITTLIFGLILTEFDMSYKDTIRYKLTVAMLRCFDEELNYYQDKSLLIDVVHRGKVLKSWYNDTIDGSDYINGYYKGNYVQFSKITINRGLSGDNIVPVFRGHYLVCNFNKNFDSHTLVLRDSLENHLGFFGQSLQNFLSAGKLVKLEHAGFERRFATYSDNQVEARYLLSPKFMEKVLEVDDMYNNNVTLGFVNGDMHIAMRTSSPVFNITGDEPLNVLDNLWKYYEPIYEVFKIIETFELNQKLWSKQD